ncbi:hypothetical protein BJV82DRAFT_675787 [Fennellomyces sp. T-0311]|nr:hypothetical protein BJV82DRAFT_675787 [Fennellomyces sp. T-0311]
MTQSAFLRPSELVKPGDTHSILTVTALKFGTVNEAFEEGKRAYAVQKYDDAVKHYTCALEALQTDLSSVIYVHRAAAYEMQSKYDLAAADGQEANPHNNAVCPDPYFAQANALYLNDQMHDAEIVFQRGAELVPKTFPQQNMLAVKYAQVSALKNNQNQHLSQLLPYEVLSRILSQLSIMDRAHLGMTCRFWNDYMFRKWPHMWHTVNLQKDFPGMGIDFVAETYLEAIDGTQVRELHLEFPDPDFDPYVDMYEGDNFDEVESEQEDWGEPILDVMDHEWSGVESLTMKHHDKSTFKKISKIIKNSIKTMTLNNSDRHSNYGVDILRAAQTFSNLQTVTNYLAGQYSSPIIDYLKDTAQLSNLKLTSLYLPQQLAAIDQICQYAPALTSLTINSSGVKDYSNVLESVHNFCPALETLNYNPKANQPLCATHTQPSPTVRGLVSLTIRPSTIYSEKNVNPQLASMFQKANKTLRTLSLHLDMLENGQFHALDILAQSGAPHLQTLILEASKTCSIGSQQLLHLLLACPSLVDISLKGLNFWHDSIFERLANLTQLRRISIGWLSRDPKAPAPAPGQDGLITGQQFELFFKHAQTVYDFTYSRPGYIQTPTTDFILQLMAAVSSSNIRTLNLFSTRLTKETLTRSLEYLKHSKIRTLKICVACALGDDEVKAFASMRCLTHLIVHDADNHIKKNHIYNLLHEWQRPQMLLVDIRREGNRKYIKALKADAALRDNYKTTFPSQTIDTR